MHIGLVERLAVNRYLLVAQFERLAGQADHAFDEIAARLLRVLEHDDVAAPRFAHRQQCSFERRHRRAENELVDEQVVADEEVVFH